MNKPAAQKKAQPREVAQYPPKEEGGGDLNTMKLVYKAFWCNARKFLGVGLIFRPDTNHYESYL
jgi:hypothetical protein